MSNVDIDLMNLPGMARAERSPTCVEFNRSNQVLVNYSGFDLVLFDASESAPGKFLQQYCGRRNEDTFLKEARFFGDGRFIVSGCDSGKLFVWEKESSKPINELLADAYILNSIAVHPTLPRIACSGIDPTVKLFDCVLSAGVKHTLIPFTERTIPFPKNLEGRGLILTVKEAQKKMSSADHHRVKGNSAFQEGNFNSSIQEYRKAVTLLCYEPPGLHLRLPQQQAMTVIFLNLAAAHLQLKEWEPAASYASSALRFEPNNVKGLYRRALSHYRLKRYEKSSEDTQKALNLDPENKKLLSLQKGLLRAIGGT